MAIITDVKQIEEASSSDLVETYNALAGKSIKKFENITIARRRVEMAMLAAKNADGQTGVPKGTEPQVRTRAEIVAKAEAKSVPVPQGIDDDEPKFEPGSLGDRLNKAARAAKKIEPRPKKEKTAGAAKKEVIYAVQATFAGTSRPQAGSVRNNVLVYIQQATNGDKVVTSAVTIEALDKHFELNTRGYVQKLLEKNHLIILDEAAFNKAKPVKKPKAVDAA